MIVPFSTSASASGVHFIGAPPFSDTASAGTGIGLGDEEAEFVISESGAAPEMAEVANEHGHGEEKVKEKGRPLSSVGLGIHNAPKVRFLVSY